MPTAPTAVELLKNPLVRQALDKAWIDSLAYDPLRRHEEGGWIYMDVSNGQISIRRAQSGVLDRINLNNPEIVLLSVVVGKFHTHPNPSVEGWNPRPSDLDVYYDDLHGVPDLIVSDKGEFVSGPTSRRGGPSGPAGYPL